MSIDAAKQVGEEVSKAIRKIEIKTMGEYIKALRFEIERLQEIMKWQLIWSVGVTILIFVLAWKTFAAEII